MSAIRLTGSTSGYAEITPSAIAGDVQLVLPSTAGTLDRLNRAGNVLQVVENTSSTVVSGISSLTSILTASITPSSASNKVLVFARCTLVITQNTNSFANVQLFRGTTSGTLLVSQDLGLQSAVSSYAGFSPFTLDSPATTSSQTYTLAANKGSVNTTSVSTANYSYSLVLIEVAA